MNNLIEVEERTSKLGDLFEYKYLSPTHWDVVCKITIGTNNKPRLHWGSGGTNSGFNDIVIADAMQQCFQLAKKRLVKLSEVKFESTI